MRMWIDELDSVKKNRTRSSSNHNKVILWQKYVRIIDAFVEIVGFLKNDIKYWQTNWC